MFSALWNGVVSLVRSGAWRTVRAKHLVVEPNCQCCGRNKEMEVHHVLPVHAGGPELDRANLISFCHDCHFVVGHACDWKAWRADVRRIAKLMRESEVKRAD